MAQGGDLGKSTFTLVSVRNHMRDRFPRSDEMALS
jgi:hypothetical protein